MSGYSLDDKHYPQVEGVGGAGKVEVEYDNDEAPQSVIRKKLDELQVSVKSLRESVSRLTLKLLPVLVQTEECENATLKDVDTAVSLDSPLASELEDLAKSLRQLSRDIRVTTGQLDL